MPEIGELQSRAGGVGEALALVVAIAAEIEDKTADGIGGIDAVVQDGIPSCVALDGLILPKSPQQIGKRLLWDFFRDDGVTKGDEYGMRWISLEARVQLMFPPIEQLEGALRIGDFVAEIVGPAAIRIYVIEMLMQFFREQPGNHIEVFVVMRGEPARVVLRGFRRAAWSRRIGGDFEFVGAQHLHLHLHSNEERVRPFLS